MSLQQLATDFEEEYKKLEEKAKSMVFDEFKKVFERHSELTAIVWTQYTPYFNDGDTCEFGVHDFTITNLPVEEIQNVTGWGEYDGEYLTEGPDATHFVTSLWGSSSNDFPDVVALEKFASTTIGEGVFKGAFGDHVIVRVTRDGIDTEEYDHD